MIYDLRFTIEPAEADATGSGAEAKNEHNT